MDYTLKKKSDLIKLCKEHNINNFENKSKNELIELLEKSNSEEYLDLNDIINKVIHTECIEIIKKIPSNSIDMICTDPPYFLDGLGNNWNKDNEW